MMTGRHVARSAWSTLPLVVIGAGVLGATDDAGSASGSPTGKPNVLLIVTDDQGYGDVAAHGNPHLRTPTLDRLRAESVRLEDYHVDPVCTPTRAALMTGRYCGRVGAWTVTQGRQMLHRREMTMADAFKASGYSTAMFGKWHLGDAWPYDPSSRGFDEVVCCRAGGVDEIGNPPGNDYTDDIYFRNGVPERFDGYCTDVFVREAIAAIKDPAEQGGAQPFFIYLATNAMHSPFTVPEAFSRRFVERGLPENRAKFYGMIENFDQNLDTLLRVLDEVGQAENTIVVFMGDNGTAANSGSSGAFNAGMRGDKGSVYDGGHRVACFVRWPAVLEAGAAVERLTCHRDWLPTLIELCDLTPPRDVRYDGRSFAPLLRDPRVEWTERTLVVDRQGTDPRLPEPRGGRRGDPTYAVMTDRWRLVNGELFDVGDDPGQSRDVADTHPGVVRALWDAYVDYFDDVYANVADDARILVGAEASPAVEFTARDWRPTKGGVVWEMGQLERDDLAIQGYWSLEIATPGVYRFELARYPFEVGRPIDATRASLRVGTIERHQELATEAASATFDVRLRAGAYRLEGAFTSAASGIERGPYYVRASPVGD